MLKHKFDIIAVSESWLNELTANLYNMDDYKALL